MAFADWVDPNTGDPIANPGDPHNVNTSPTPAYNLNYGGATLNVQDAGMMNPSQLNPYAAGYLNNTNNLYSMFSNSAAGGAFNPSFYNGMRDTSEHNITSSMSNMYASRGLSGSSAEMGGLNQAIQNNQMAWLNRQQNDQMHAMQGLTSLNNMGYGQTMGIQNQYQSFNDAANQDIVGLVGADQQRQASENQMYGQLASAVIGSAGSMAAGPYGAGMYGRSGGMDSYSGFNMNGDNTSGLTMSTPYNY